MGVKEAGGLGGRQRTIKTQGEVKRLQMERDQARRLDVISQENHSLVIMIINNNDDRSRACSQLDDMHPAP